MEAAAPPLIYLFGLPGVGKNWVGEQCASLFGVRFADADDWLLPEQHDALAAGRGFTPDMRDRYYAEVAARMAALKGGVGVVGGGSGLAVGQATFKAQHRRAILAAHPEAQLWWVRTAEPTRMQRLRDRGSVVGDELGRRMAADFEAPRLTPAGQPTHPEEDGCHAVVSNDGDADATRAQLRALLGDRTSTVAPTGPEAAGAGLGMVAVEDAKRIDAALARVLTATPALPAAPVAVAAGAVIEGATVYCGGAGVSDEGVDCASCGPTTVFVTASISKTFLAALVLQCAERGELDLDGDINRPLNASFSGNGLTISNPHFPAATVTARHLLTHRSGLQDDESNLTFGSPYRWEAVSAVGKGSISLVDYARQKLTPNAESAAVLWSRQAPPGEAAYHYSNAGCVRI